MSWGFQYREYVPVAQKKAQGRRYALQIAKRKRRDVQPVSIQGKKIAKTFWGTAWCDHLERFSDFANRLPRGRTYIRNGSVVDLQITAGRLKAIVAGSDPYGVTVEIARLKPARWKKVRDECASSIDSLLDLLGGRFSDGVMQRLTDRDHGLFPAPEDIDMRCSCPDWAVMCKHVAAVLYGVGAHLDKRPELLFVLRGVDHHELVSEAVSQENLSAALGEPADDLAGEDLGAMFGIELDTARASTTSQRAPTKGRPRARKASGRKAGKTKSAKKRPAKKTSVKKTPATKSAIKKSAIKKSAVKKSAVKKSAVKKSAKKRPAKKASAKKKSPGTVKKKAAARKSPKKPPKKKASRKKK